ncbi:unnamed protein product [Rotaria sordida]|uniref:Uncharacterized protein n=1 Tax=Rotaria sordida TaxID=392033 RepID=A0A815C946_9BILA|nr:unnamed protein product [Rotaria sordida]
MWFDPIGPDYSFEPPEFRFVTPIYHPNIDKAEKYLLMSSMEAIPDLINHPQINYSLNVDIDAEYASNRAEVSRKALDSVKQHDLPR